MTPLISSGMKSKRPFSILSSILPSLKGPWSLFSTFDKSIEWTWQRKTPSFSKTLLEK
jgi:hypothetical protein